MKIYNDYIDTINAAIRADRKSNPINERYASYNGGITKSFSFSDYCAKVPEKKLLPSLESLSKEVGLQINFDQQLGLHPDFAHLKHSEKTESHYIISVFIDIKGSTNLFMKYDPETVLIITNTIQRAAIHTCLIFGGYIHRLQGDGLFVYFGGKNKDIKTSVLRALQSTSVFTHFVKNDLKDLFLEQGIDKINTRIGIDLGYDADVIWAMAGIGEISEVTTCSLHTSLASKMQSSAESNGIVIGDNVKTNLDLSFQNLAITVSKRTGNENDRYIFRNPNDNFYYTQYDFDWFNFLKRQFFIATDLQGNIGLKQKEVINQNRNVEFLAPIAALNKPYYF
jgi:adenylate cyclase